MGTFGSPVSAFPREEEQNQPNQELESDMVEFSPQSLRLAGANQTVNQQESIARGGIPSATENGPASTAQYEARIAAVNAPENTRIEFNLINNPTITLGEEENLNNVGMQPTNPGVNNVALGTLEPPTIARPAPEEAPTAIETVTAETPTLNTGITTAPSTAENPAFENLETNREYRNPEVLQERPEVQLPGENQLNTGVGINTPQAGMPSPGNEVSQIFPQTSAIEEPIRLQQVGSQLAQVIPAASIISVLG
jgi:hypothetical protein